VWVFGTILRVGVWQKFKSSRIWRKFKKIGPVKTFNDFGYLSKATLIVMFVLGWIVLYFCYREDLSGSKWWHSLSYVPNIWAGFTGFLIGAPVAAVILASFTVEREERTTLDRVNRISTLAWNQYRDSIYLFCNAGRIDALERSAQHVQKAHDETLALLRNFRQPNSGTRLQPPTEAECIELVNYSRNQVSLWQNALIEINAHIPPSGALQSEWYAILTNWSTLDEYVRLQRLERGLRWFDNNINSYLTYRMSVQGHPLIEFSNAHDERQGNEIWKHENAHWSMAAMFESLRGLIESRKEEFLQRVLSPTPNDGFPWWGIIPKYALVAETAAKSLRGLRDSVKMVDAANWPASASKPSDDT
jgi:hypothetical protein